MFCVPQRPLSFYAFSISCHQAQLWGALSRSELVTSALGVAVPSVVQSVFWGLALELLVVIAVGYSCKVRVFVFTRQRVYLFVDLYWLHRGHVVEDVSTRYNQGLSTPNGRWAGKIQAQSGKTRQPNARSPKQERNEKHSEPCGGYFDVAVGVCEGMAARERLNVAWVAMASYSARASNKFACIHVGLEHVRERKRLFTETHHDRRRLPTRL